MIERPTQEFIELWLELVSKEFHYTEACDGQWKAHSDLWPQLRVLMRRCVKKGLIEESGKRDGWYRPVDSSAMPLDWNTEIEETDSGIILPLGLREYIYVYWDTTGIYAGAKSSGKTALIYQTAKLNIPNRKVILLTNLEGGLAMLRDRLKAVGIEQSDSLEVRNVNENFHDYINQSNALYLVDYIDAPEGTDFFMIAHLIKKIDQKLQGLHSNAIVALQKPFGRDFAYGGEQTMKSATFYLALDTNKIKIVDAKVPAQRKLHPKNMMWTFQFNEDGAEFLNIERFYGE